MLTNTVNYKLCFLLFSARRSVRYLDLKNCIKILNNQLAIKKCVDSSYLVLTFVTRNAVSVYNTGILVVQITPCSFPSLRHNNQCRSCSKLTTGITSLNLKKELEYLIIHYIMADGFKKHYSLGCVVELSDDMFIFLAKKYLSEKDNLYLSVCGVSDRFALLYGRNR